MLNHITLMGRLVANPELRTTNSGIKVAAMRIAVDRDYSKEKETDFFDIVAWRGTAEFVCRYFTKGKPILVDGSLRTRKWTDKEGNNRIAFEIHAENVYFAGGEKTNNSEPVLSDIDDSDGELPWADDDLPL